MQFSAVFVAIAAIAGSAAAHPAADAFHAQAASSLKALEASGCEVLKCLVAAAPMAATCAAALVEAGVNPIADLSCFATVANNIVNPPEPCMGCL